MSQDTNPFAGATPPSNAAPNNPYAAAAPAPAPTPAPQSVNPYAAPTANVEAPIDYSHTTDYFQGGRSVPAGNGAAWLVDAWSLFMRAPGTWIGVFLLAFVLSVAISLVPLVGTIAVNVLMPVVFAGLALGCRSLEQGDGLNVNHLFAGFGDKTGSLVAVGLLYLIAVIVVVIAMVVVGLVFGGIAGLSGAYSGKAGVGLGALTIVLILLVGMLVTMPVLMGIWFAPVLVMFHNRTPMEAIKESFTASLRNILPFLFYSFLGIVLAIVATIPFALGWLVLMPVAFISMYTSYKDIFLGD